MKLRYKILTGVAGVLVLGIATIMTVTAHDSPCPAAPASAEGDDSMRAVTRRCYGIAQGLHVERLAKPVPKEGRILIKVHASSVNPVEWYGATGQPYVVRLGGGIGTPDDWHIGTDVAGVVAAVAADVTEFKVGDEVFGAAYGAYAEYATSRANGGIVHKPAELSFEEAAGIPIAALTALQGLRDQGRIKPGQKVLINGASGGVGTYAVQIAKALGAEVTGVCSTRNVEMVRSLGADHVVDYTQADFTRGEVRYDVILDNVGNHSYFDLADVTTPNGIIVTVGGQKKDPWLGPIRRIGGRLFVAPFIEQELPFFIAQFNKADMQFLADLAHEKKLRTVIDRRYPLEQAAAAIEYLGTQRARGKIIVTVH